jgi:DNA-cytosine methyltransferase
VVPAEQVLGLSTTPKRSTMKSVPFTARANIALAFRQDSQLDFEHGLQPNLRRALAGADDRLNVVELFAGAGGLGLGFMAAQYEKIRYRLISSTELNPIYAATLKRNHSEFARRVRPDATVATCLPSDLRAKATLERLASEARSAGGAHVVVGGPPCQGFSNANRNSWSSGNPNNRLVGVFVDYIEKLVPRAFVMENVQGILWTSASGSRASAPTVVESIARRLERAGYVVFPKLLDAVWYGAPQYRSRFFLVGLHRDLGYKSGDFGSWGPFPKPTHGPGRSRPYVTVGEAIGDLPVLGNGSSESPVAYQDAADAVKTNRFLSFVRTGAPKGTIYDHVTSKHAPYVIDRYRRIPQGGNWEDVVDSMSNYADVKRTHSNIYRRLIWDQPSITIGHYRKSMLIHPRQHRGLSLREASRLQAFPDWFRFCGTSDGGEGGLVHKQQQLANAVSPLVSQAIAQFVLAM